jgi:sphingomyelin phosphodiesterase acid-like 3
MQKIKNHFAAIIVSLLVLSASIISVAFRYKTVNKEELTKKCLIVSDIHFSPLYGSLNDTALKRKLERSSFDEWKKYFRSSAAQMVLDRTLLYHDANYAVLQSALLNMKKKLPHPAFIIIAGDFIWHGATPADSILKRKSIQFIAQLFKENFPGTTIIPAMGNNDTYGNDYAMQDPKFLKDFAAAWEPNLTASSGDSLKANGYYTCKTGNLKLIVINSSLVSNGSKYPQAARTMFKWLKGSLAAAEGKNVWVISHIPPGLNGFNNSKMWNGEYTKAFVDDIVKYAPEVKFMIASHTHFDDFRVVYNTAKEPVSFMRIVPSVCSNHGNNPSFEVAEFNNATGRVISETNWYLNLATAPKNESPEQVIWADVINLPAFFKLGEINAKSFSKLIDNIKGDHTLLMVDNYSKFYNVGANIDSLGTISHRKYLNYLKADSLK